MSPEERLKTGLAMAERIKAVARSRGEDTRLLQMRFAQERLLARIQDGQYRNRFLLKGGLMFSCKSTGSSRPTNDIDLHDTTGLGLRNIAQAIHESAQADLGDGVDFDLSTFKVTPIREQGNPGIRIVMNATIGRSIAHVSLDLCTGDAVTPAPVMRQLPSVLPREFGAVSFRSYPWETSIAEKLHAITTLGFTTTRMKDFYDIATIAQDEVLDAASVCLAIRRTFDTRAGAEIEEDPVGLGAEFVAEKSRDFANWVAYMEPPESRDSLEKVVGICRELLMPALAALVAGEPLEGTWEPGQGWSAASHGYGR